MKRKLAVNSVNVRSITLLKKKVNEDLTAEVSMATTKESWYARHQAASTFWATVISAMALIFSVKVLYDTRKDSASNLGEMKNQNFIAQKALDSTLEGGKAQFRYQDSINNLTISILQNQLFQERKQFNTENSSELQFEEMDVLRLAPNSTIEINYLLNNKGKLPIKILKSRYIGYLDSVFHQNPFKHYAKSKWKPQFYAGNAQINASKPFLSKFTFEVNLDSVEYNLFLKEKVLVYLAGDIDFINPVNGQPKRYSFISSVNYPLSLTKSYMQNKSD